MTDLCDSVLQSLKELSYQFESVYSQNHNLRLTEAHLDPLLAAARYLSKCPPTSVDNRSKLALISFLRLLPAFFTSPLSIWPSDRFFTFFVDFLGFVENSVPDDDVAGCMRDVVIKAFGTNWGPTFLRALIDGGNKFVVTLLCSDCELLKTLVLLIEAAKASLDSELGNLTIRVQLFGSLLDTIAHIAVNLDCPRLNVLLICFRPLLTVTCAQAAVKWGCLQGRMLESLINTSCKIIELLWSKDYVYPVCSFFYKMESCISQRNDSNEYDVNLRQIVLCILADLTVRLRIAEIVDILLPLFSRILQHGEGSDPGILRHRLLDAICCMATFGSEMSYFKTVNLMATSYLDELYSMETLEQKKIPSEADAKGIKILAAGFLRIASDLTDHTSRVDYLYLLLHLCSDVGMATESENGCGADSLGPLLPAVAEICYDIDPTSDIKPKLCKLFRNLWYYIALYGLASPILKNHITKELSSKSPNALQAVDEQPMWERSHAVHRIALGTPAFAVSSAQWCKDEMELREMHDYCNRQKNENKKLAVNQRVALSAALMGRVNVSAISEISGVTATYLLAIIRLERIRFSSNGGILYEKSELRAHTSALSYIFEYLKTPNLEAGVFKCLSAILHHAFGAAVSWLEKKITTDRRQTDAEVHLDTLDAHLCFLIKNMYERDEYVRDISVKFLAQLWDKFPQILWSSVCLDHLSLVLSEPAAIAAGVTDPETAAAVFSSNRKFVREWIICCLSFAPPCTAHNCSNTST